jgi:hypothetical protein
MRRAGRPANRRSNSARRAPSPVTRIRKPPRGIQAFPAADPFFEPPDRFDRDVEVFVLRPARGTHHEARHDAANAETGEQRRAELFALGALDRREHGGRAVVEDLRTFHAEAAFQKRGQRARHAQIAFDPARVAPLVPARKPHSRMPPAQPQPQQRVADVVPVDHEPDAFASQRKPGDRQRRKLRRVLHQNELGTRKRSERAPETKTETKGVHQRGKRIGEAGQPFAAAQQ